MMVKVYPFEVPDGVHPMAFLLLGCGLSVDVADRVARHLFDDMGVRFREVEPEEYTYSWAVSWALDPKGRVPVEVGEHCEIQVPGGDTTAVQLVAGSFPPGVHLEWHTGKIVGRFDRPGLYEVTVRVGTKLKWDPKGLGAQFTDPGVWIPVDQPRDEIEVDMSEFPITVNDLDDYSKDLLLSKLLDWRTQQAVKAADNGY